MKQKEKKVITPERKKYLMELNAAWHREQELRCEEDEDDDNNSISMEEEEREWRLWCRHGMNDEDWRDFQILYYRHQDKLWREFFVRERGSDFDCSCIFIVLKFRIERMIDYWEEFSHSANGSYILAQMRLATRLIDIVLGEGNEGMFDDSIPYVNQHNKNRIPKICFGSSAASDSETMDLKTLRYRKAYNLLFKLLKDNIMNWWD